MGLRIPYEYIAPITQMKEIIGSIDYYGLYLELYQGLRIPCQAG